MVEVLAALLPTLLTIVGFILKEKYSIDGQVKRREYERDKALVKQDSATISEHLSDGFDRLQRYNQKRKNGRSHS